MKEKVSRKKEIFLDRRGKISSKRTAGIACIINGTILCFFACYLVAIGKTEGIEYILRATTELFLAGTALLGASTFEKD